MTRYALLTYSTDMRAPRYRIAFTTSREAVKRHIAREAVLTHGANADAARNHHHDLTAAYELPKGWRKPSQREIDDELFRRHGSVYSPRDADHIIAERIQRDGEEVVSIS